MTNMRVMKEVKERLDQLDQLLTASHGRSSDPISKDNAYDFIKKMDFKKRPYIYLKENGAFEIEWEHGVGYAVIPTTKGKIHLAECREKISRLEVFNDVDQAVEYFRARNHQCTWTQDEDGVFDTSCGERFNLDSGTPSENGFGFCCYCGNRLKCEGVKDGEETDSHF